MELTLACETAKPLYRMLADSIRSAIESGQLAPGSSLPSARQLARQYHISTSTALRALDDLVACGYLQAVAKKEFRVRTNLALDTNRACIDEKQAAMSKSAPNVAIFAQRILDQQVHTAELFEAGVNTPEPQLLPMSQWQRLIAKHCQHYADREFIYSYRAHPFGLLELREAVSQYLKRARGIICSPDQVVISAAARLDYFCRLVLNPGDSVAIENPSVPIARRIILGHGAKLEYIPVDEYGAQVEQLKFLADKPRFVYVTPSHQDPTGAVMTVERRLQLLRWAQANDVLVWENDFDYHFQHSSLPIPAVAGLIPNQCVFYSGTFWLTLGPLTALNYIVVPTNYIDHAAAVCGAAMQSESMILEQSALAEFISSGLLEKHLHKMRQMLNPQRQLLIHELTKGLKGLATISPGTGTHLVVHFHRDLPLETILQCSQETGLILMPIKPYYVGPYSSHVFLMPFNCSRERLEIALCSFIAVLSQRAS